METVLVVPTRGEQGWNLMDRSQGGTLFNTLQGTEQAPVTKNQPLMTGVNSAKVQTPV